MNKFSDQKKASTGKSKDDNNHQDQAHQPAAAKQTAADKAKTVQPAVIAQTHKATTAVTTSTAKGELKSDPSKNKWKSKVNAAKNNWGKLSTSEILKSDGDAQMLADLVHLRYSIPMVEANKQVKQFLDKCHS